jgi:uncharacterized membrane protein YhhN
MLHDFVLIGSIKWTVFFFVLVGIAVFTQLTKGSLTSFIPGLVRHLIKASPALFLAGVSWSIGGPMLVTAGFVFCGLGDILLDIPEEKAPLGFELGAISFAAALICLSIVYIGNRIEGYPILPLALTNTVIAIFVLRWVFPKLKKGVGRGLELVYFSILIISNIIASTASVPIFLGSSLWLMSDLSIGLSSNIIEVPANSLDTLGLYDLGLYFLAIGLLAGVA